ncbi:hypothetical protein [Herbaspirillum sp. 1130]|uniref:beta strand repeat-containing protein n=1 Tax=Herbaspirillum sp. 1130 TaxID=2806562 RepID=UPI001AE3C933|nr:hypothetical protein [Herbaspirillum sp. 1130]MBP1314194.1 hypothetical protein [Herbaspirillum sp. 1130]
MAGSITISVVAPGALESNGKNSIPGHIWYTVTDSNGHSRSFGFEPLSQGTPFGAGTVTETDGQTYLSGIVFAQSAPLTDAQVQAALTYGNSIENLASGKNLNSLSAAGAQNIDTTLSSADTNYNVLGGMFSVQGFFGNNCESFVDGMFDYVSRQTGTPLATNISAFSLPEWQAGSAAKILNGLEAQNGGQTITTTEECGDNDEYTCTITGHYSAADGNGNRTLLSDSWTSSDGSKGTDVYSAPGNFQSTVTHTDGSGAVTTYSNGTYNQSVTGSDGKLTSAEQIDSNNNSEQSSVNNADGSSIDDIKNFQTSGISENEQVITRASNGDVNDAISGTSAVANLSNAAISLADGADVTINGSANAISVGNSNGLIVNGNGDAVSIAGMNDHITLNGASDNINGGTNIAVATEGEGERINLGTGSTLTVSGGSVTATLNNGSLVVGSGSAVVLNGSTDVVSASDNSTVTVAGAGNTLNVSGAGVTTTESGYSNTLNISGTSDSTTATGTGTLVNVSGWKDSTGINGQNDIVTVTGSGNDNTSVAGTSDTATVRGSYDVTTISGWKDNSSIQGQGDSTYVTGSGNDNTYVSGTSDGTVVSGNYDQTAVNGWQDTSFINGQGDSTYVTGSGNDNTYVSGTSDGTEVSGNYDQTNVSGWMDNSFIKGQGDSTNVSGSGNDDTYVTGTSDGTTVTGNYDETVVGGWKDDSYIQGQGDSTYVTGSGNDNTYVSGISDGTLVTGNYDETFSSGSDDSEIIEGQGDVTPTPSGDGDTVDYGGTLDAPSSPDMPDDPFNDDDDPLILSLNKDPVKTQGLSNTAAVFDMQNSGQAVKTGWGTAGEGYLVYDPNDAADSTVVKQDHQLVAGFSALQALAQAVDGTSKGWLNGSDSLWGDLKVWVDTTGTGQFQQGQLMSLDQLGITGIDLNASTVHENSNGNTILSDGRYMLASGETGDIAGVDLVFNTDASAGAANKVTQLIQAMASYSPESSSSTVISPDLSTAQQTLLATPH